MVTRSISEKIRLSVLRRTVPVPAELLLLGCCTRGWILDHGTMIQRLSDRSIYGFPDIGKSAREWCDERCHTGRNVHWKDFSIEDLAEGIGEPVSTVRDWFQLVAETDFRKWKTNLRIEFAKTLLEENRESIAQVAHRTGFSDIANFSRQFRRITGCSPSQWMSQF